MASNNSTICPGQLLTFKEEFHIIYGPLATIICVISIVFNICNIIVLSHKEMISSTNCLLTGIAVSDFIKVITLLPMLLRFRVFSELASLRVVNPHDVEHEEVSSPLWAGYFLLSSIVALITHTAALWLAVVLALFRYLCIKLYTNPRIKLLFSVERAKLSIFLVYAIVVLMFTPYFCIVYVQHKNYRLAGNINHSLDLYMGTMRPEASKKIQAYSFWIHSVFGKFLPCVIMSIFGVLLIATLNATQGRCESLVVADDQSASALRNARRFKDHQRTTRMLITIITLYSITEIPNAIFTIVGRHMSSLLSMYFCLGEIFDLIALFNNTVNFLLYCMMSAKFREIFAFMFCCWFGANTAANSGTTAAAAVEESHTAAGNAHKSLLKKSVPPISIDKSVRHHREQNANHLELR